MYHLPLAVCGVLLEQFKMSTDYCPIPDLPVSNRSQSGLVHIWSLQTRRTVATLNGHGGQGVTWLKPLPQGHQLLR